MPLDRALTVCHAHYRRSTVSPGGQKGKDAKFSARLGYLPPCTTLPAKISSMAPMVSLICAFSLAARWVSACVRRNKAGLVWPASQSISAHWPRLAEA